MDLETINYYARNAGPVAARYESAASGLAASFSKAWEQRSKLLDIGCGSGRDLAYLAALGHDCFGIDATLEFVDISQRLHPELRGRVIQASLPTTSIPFGGGFDGVLCSAVLMHIPEKQLAYAALSIKQCLKESGRLLYSVPTKRNDISVGDRDEFGRLFITVDVGRYQEIFQEIGFRQISKWESADSLGRETVSWLSVLMELSNRE